ncbi:MAG TPA: aminotransferase class I/II-fold pyridoxal phosphate-dependent enzyme [Syntrophales bacterium]|nr:aminotransferase class I/II-fold pyridoxal phosphate-dependent enzyme [Syntrophales bacterium]
MKLTKRIQSIKPSPTLAITMKANALRAQGRDIIGFGAGEPDFDTPENIKAAAVRAIASGFTKYTPVGGIDELKDAIAAKMARDHGLDYNRSQIVVSCGAKHTLYNLIQVLCEGEMKSLCRHHTGFLMSTSSFWPVRHRSLSPPSKRRASS